MVTVEDIRKDKRFFICDETLEYISKRPMKNYRIREICVGKIHRFLDRKVFSLYKTVPYKFLTNMDDPCNKEMYANYCIRASVDNKDRSISHFQELAIEFDDEYDINKGIIIIDQFGFVVDGQHRACLLLNKNGENHKIKVLQIRFLDFGISPYILNLLYLIKRALRIDC